MRGRLFCQHLADRTASGIYFVNDGLNAVNP
jgi:hypothetical protein